MRRLPAEWESQTATLLTWPHGDSDWGDDLEAIETAFVALAAAIGAYQPLVITVPDVTRRDAVNAALRDCGVAPERFRLAVAPSDDIWVRDHGPITVLDDHGALPLDFRFNGWGHKHRFTRDTALTGRLHALGMLGPRAPEPIDAVLEGGAIDTDGAGTVLTTRRCLLHPNRNGDVDTDWYETRFREWFGSERVLWLRNGHLDGDDTDGHVDMLVRFTAPDTLVHVYCEDPSDTHYDDLQALAAELEQLRQPDGRPYRRIPLPWPPAVHEEGRRLPLSYANFVLANGAVIVPTYRVATDEAACTLFARLYPDRAVVPVDARPLIRQSGSLHCATMQLPAASGHHEPSRK